jgi:hypothetical protein
VEIIEAMEKETIPLYSNQIMAQLETNIST